MANRRTTWDRWTTRIAGRRVKLQSTYILDALGVRCNKQCAAHTGGGTVLVARVVLANFDDETAAQLIQLLQRARHRVTQLSAATFDHGPRAIGQVACDLIILDVSSDDRATRALLTEALRHRAECGPRPMLLCVTRADRGPRYEFDLERKGARLAYVS